MRECFRCKHKGELSHVCDECLDGEMFEKKVITNADRVRNMTIEELAEILCEFHACVLCEHQDDGVCLVSECKEIEITKRWLMAEMGE